MRIMAAISISTSSMIVTCKVIAMSIVATATMVMVMVMVMAMPIAPCGSAHGHPY